MKRRNDRGQATIELVAMLPLIAAVGLGLLQLLAAGLTAQFADHAAESGAIALAEGRPAPAAARAALPGWSHGSLAVSVRGRRVRVRIAPPTLLPGLAGALTAEAWADAGPP